MTDVASVFDHQRPAPDVTKRMEKHMTVLWHRHWETLSLLESKRHEDPAAYFFLLRIRFRRRLRMLKEAGIHNYVIRHLSLDDPRPSDIDFHTKLAGAKKRRERNLDRKRTRNANRVGNSTEQSSVGQ